MRFRARDGLEGGCVQSYVCHQQGQSVRVVVVGGGLRLGLGLGGKRRQRRDWGVDNGRTGSRVQIFAWLAAWVLWVSLALFFFFRLGGNG